MDIAINGTHKGASLPPIGSKWWPRLASTKQGVVTVLAHTVKMGKPALTLERDGGGNRTNYLLESFSDGFVPYDPGRHVVQAPSPKQSLTVPHDSLVRLEVLARKYESIALQATGIMVTVRVEDVLTKVLELGLIAAASEVHDE